MLGANEQTRRSFALKLSQEAKISRETFHAVDFLVGNDCPEDVEWVTLDALNLHQYEDAFASANGFGLDRLCRWVHYDQRIGLGRHYAPCCTNAQSNRLGGGWWFQASKAVTYALRFCAPLPRCPQGQEHVKGYHGYGLDLDFGGWVFVEHLVDALIRHRRDLHGWHPITAQALMNIVFGNVKRRNALLIPYTLNRR